MIKIEEDKKYTSTSRIRKLLQKSDKEFLWDNALTERVVKKRSSVKVRNQSRKDVLETKEEVCRRINTQNLRRR